MKKVTMAFVAAVLSCAAPALEVTSVTAQQRFPWNGKVDLEVTLSGSETELSLAEFTFAATNAATQTALAVETVAEVADTGAATKRHFVWDTDADVPNVRIDAVTFVVHAKMLGVQLWKDGPYWAECNVGATKPEEYGHYFWWGDTVGYTRVGDSWNAVDGSRTGFSFEGGNCPTYGKGAAALRSEGWTDAAGNLAAAHDAATAHLGAPWRMPTKSEMDALVSNCTTTWTTRNGVYGWLVTGKGDYASKSIFLPAAGYGYGSSLYYSGSNGCYWSSTPNSSNSYYACSLFFHSDSFYLNYFNRYYGRPVRALR